MGEFRIGAIGTIYYLKNDFCQSLEYVDEAINILSLRSGGAPKMGPLYYLKTKIYIALGIKKFAKKSLKRFSRYVLDEESKKTVEYLRSIINDLPEFEYDLSHCHDERPVEKCSYYLCEKVEESPGQFKSCARCRLVHYCSKKCQKKDWKISHKKFCN